MGLWTNNGLTLIATAVQTPGANVAPQYVGISPGCGTLSGAITASTPVTSLPLDATLPVTLGSGQGLTVTDGVNSETVTVAAGGASAGAGSITINSWTPVHNYAAHTTGVCPTPLTSDTALYNETQRLGVTAASAGGSPGESLIIGYFDGTQPTAVYLLVGWFGGATATATVGTGTLMAEDIVVWNHTVNADTFMYQGDGII
jgi:hypothetical protein